MPAENIILCDTKGVIYQGRTEGMNQWKSAHAVETEARTLAEAMKGADVLLRPVRQGRADATTMVRSMAAKPIIFAMANPDPEITPEEVARDPRRRDRRDRALGLSQPGQQRPRLPLHLPRRARRARHAPSTRTMKIAAAHALAELAREDVPDEVAAAYQGVRPKFGPHYIIPVPFDPRLISPRSRRRWRKAAMDIGRRAQADRRHGRLQDAALGAARSDRRHAAAHLPARAARRRSASSSPRARRSR